MTQRVGLRGLGGRAPDRSETVPVIVAARRTPVGTAGHGLARVDATGLLAPVWGALRDDLVALGVLADGARIDDVVAGNCLGPGGNPARVAALAGGLGIQVPGVTVDRQCGSGQEAIHLAAAMIAAGSVRVILAGGVESASTAPQRAFRPVDPGGELTPYDRAPFAPAAFGDPDMGPAADDLARLRGVARERQDAYAARSHARTRATAAAGGFDAELVPVADLVADERPRRLTTATLARLRPVFDPAGTVTAGNCCGISDGAAAVALVPAAVRASLGVPGLVVLDWLAVGVDPAWPGLGPVPAVEALLARNGLTVDDLEAVEITEAFAAQVLAATDALGLDPLGADDDVVCSQGGAIALGHPWGASGALLAVRLFARLVRSATEAPTHQLLTGQPPPDQPPPGQLPRRLGVATCAVGGGQGLAMLVERVG